MTVPTVELRMDLFPASVIVNPGEETETTYEPSRLLVGLDEVWVWMMVNGSAELVFNERIEGITGRRTTGWTATLGDGRTIKFRRAAGCGCGNPLRGWQPPFMTVQGALSL